MRYKEIIEQAGVGRVVPGVNTTADVGPGTLAKQVDKFFGKAGANPDGTPARKRKKKKRS